MIFLVYIFLKLHMWVVSAVFLDVNRTPPWRQQRIQISSYTLNHVTIKSGSFRRSRVLEGSTVWLASSIVFLCVYQHE